MSAFRHIRTTLEAQRARIAAQLEAIDQAEAALARLLDVYPGIVHLFGVDPAIFQDDFSRRSEAISEGGARGRPPGAAEGASASRRADSVTAAADRDARAEVLTCQECGSEFPRKSRSGPIPKTCSPKCYRAFKARKPEPTPEPEPGPEPEPPVTNGASGPPSLPPEPEPAASGELEERQCAYCQEPFTPTNPDHKYCDRTCKEAARSDERDRRRAMPWAATRT